MTIANFFWLIFVLWALSLFNWSGRPVWIGWGNQFLLAILIFILAWHGHVGFIIQ